MIFINNMCENLQMEKKDLVVFFMNLKNEKKFSRNYRIFRTVQYI